MKDLYIINTYIIFNYLINNQRFHLNKYSTNFCIKYFLYHRVNKLETVINNR